MSLCSVRADFGQYVLTSKQIPPMDSMILLEGGHEDGRVPYYARSTAALRIMAQLQPAYLFKPLWGVLLIPASLRDLGYKAFASVRYRLFGTVAEEASECRRATLADRPRFIELYLADQDKAEQAASKPLTQTKTSTGGAHQRKKGHK
jgi:predicted DCC family thiol-disulfide oxidoreductase YuxK